MKAKIFVGLSVLVFGVVGALVGRMIAHVAEKASPLLSDYWSWLGPLIGIAVSLVILRFIYYARQHRPPEQ